MNFRSQGSTEYLLILAGVLIVAAMAVFFLSSVSPHAIIAGTAENSGENIVFTPSSTMVPENISSTDWEWAVYASYGTILVDFTAPGTMDCEPAAGTTLSRRTPVTLGAVGIDLGTTGDVLKIRYKKSDVFETTIY